MNDIQAITKALRDFRDARDWAQFHDSRNLALGLSIEAAELNELFLWKKTIEEAELVDQARLKEELADVFSFAFLLADKHQLDVKEIIFDKIKKNGEKYPINKAKGSAKKYTEF